MMIVTDVVFLGLDYLLGSLTSSMLQVMYHFTLYSLSSLMSSHYRF
jgi:hypothetical protein